MSSIAVSWKGSDLSCAMSLISAACRETSGSVYAFIDGKSLDLEAKLTLAYLFYTESVKHGLGTLNRLFFLEHCDLPRALGSMGPFAMAEHPSWVALTESANSVKLQTSPYEIPEGLSVASFSEGLRREEKGLEWVGLGGTFSSLHASHFLLLSAAALAAKKVLVGVTSTALCGRKSLPEFLESQEFRTWNVLEFLRTFDKGLGLEGFSIERPEDGWDKPLEALITSDETGSAVPKFNLMRDEIGLKPLANIQIKLMECSEGDKWGSTKVRENLRDLLGPGIGFSNMKSFLKSSLEVLKKKALGLGEAETIWSELLSLYSLPLRFYHSLGHINDCLSKLLSNFAFKLGREELAVAAVAIAFHDAIYNPKKSGGSNEKNSAILARHRLSQIGVEEELIKKVENVILSTEKHHCLTNSLVEKVVLDIDLSIFSDPPKVYLQYAKNIRSEYSHIELSQFCEKRAKVMEGFLLKDRLFLTEGVFSESRAKSNLREEIDRLKSGKLE